jgi:hypothetical protein
VTFKLENRVKDSSTQGDYWDVLQCKACGYPEQDLLLAVLKDALLSYRRNLGRLGKIFEAERAWFFDNDSDRLFSFESVCASLGLSAQRIRSHLLAWERDSALYYSHYLSRGTNSSRIRSDSVTISARQLRKKLRSRRRRAQQLTGWNRSWS